MKNKQSSIVIGVMCFLLTMGIVIQVTSIKNESTVIAQENTENELRDEVLKLTDDYNKLYSKLEKNEDKLEKIRESVEKDNKLAGSWSEELEKIECCLGLSKLSGSGVTIELPEGDLLLVINALNNAGAEAISINNNRIVFGTKIKIDGDIVLINDQELSAPYIINAIGSDTVYGAITMPGSHIDLLKSKGINVEVKKSSNIEIPKYNGVYSFEFAKNKE